jgi:hypothetical protein
MMGNKDRNVPDEKRNHRFLPRFKESELERVNLWWVIQMGLGSDIFRVIMTPGRRHPEDFEHEPVVCCGPFRNERIARLIQRHMELIPWPLPEKWRELFPPGETTPRLEKLLKQFRGW